MKLDDEGRISFTVREAVSLYWFLGQAMEHLDDKRHRLLFDSLDARKIGDSFFERAAKTAAKRVSKKLGEVSSFRAKLSTLTGEVKK